MHRHSTKKEAQSMAEVVQRANGIAAPGKRCSIAVSFVAAFAFASMASTAFAEIVLPKLLSDHAVLQRDRPVHVWGWASPSARLTVTLHSQSMQVAANDAGEWTLWLQPEAAGGPYTLTVVGEGNEGRVTVSDLLMGDVWIASGQSNMELPLSGYPRTKEPFAVVRDAEAEIAAASHPNLRLLKVPRTTSDFPLGDIGGSWMECNPQTAADFSAVAYFFGRELEAKEHVPIGLIDSAWGGTPADSWISLEGLLGDASLVPVLMNRARYQRELAREPALNAMDKRHDEAAKAAGTPAPRHSGHGVQTAGGPTGLYNGMIAPLASISVKGFIWYQGESDSGPERSPSYASLFPALIKDWRSHFAQGDLPFLYAQLSSFDGAAGWPRVQDAQRRALALRSTAMAMTTDVGDAKNIHPADKQTVGARLALAARAVAYQEPVAFQAPLFRQAVPIAGGMQVWFDHAEGLSSSQRPIPGFEVAGADHRFFPAEAEIDAGSVRVKCTAVVDPRFVRYAWSPIAPVALRNAAGLPASVFTSEDEFMLR